MGIRIMQVYPETINDQLEEVSQWLAAGLLSEYYWQADVIVQRALQNECQVFAVVSENDKIIGVFSTEIIDYAHSTELSVISFKCEQFDEVKAEIDKFLVEFAQSENCAFIVSLSRRGMLKKLNALGFAEEAVYLRKPVTLIH